MNPSVTVVIILSLASVLALAVTILLTAGAVYWQTSTHYQEILREKDASYWEHLGRAQTHGLHCEDQCKRLMDSSNHYYSTLIGAYEDRLKSLLDTDVQSIQMREQSHREVLNIFHNQAVLVNEQTQSPTVQCVHYCQTLHSKLIACNQSLASQRTARRHAEQRSGKQQASVVFMHKILTDCRSEKEQSSNYTSWLALSVAVAGAIACGYLFTYRRDTTVTNSSIKKPTPKDTKPSVKELIATHITHEAKTQLLTKQLTEAKKQCERMNEQLKETEKENKRMTKQLEESVKDSRKAADLLKEKLASTENEVSLLKRNREEEHAERVRLKESLHERQKELDELAYQIEALTRKNKKLESYYEKQLACREKTCTSQKGRD